MRRALLATFGLAGIAATAAPVLAGPAPADTGRMAGTQLTTALPGGDSLRLEIRAAQLSAGPRLLVFATRCDDQNCVSHQYGVNLPADALTIDSSAAQAELSVPLDGRRLTVRWRPDGGQGPEAAYGSTDAEDGTGSQYLGSPAITTVDFDGHTCSGSGGVGQGTVVDLAPVTGDNEPAPLSGLQIPAGTAFRC